MARGFTALGSSGSIISMSVVGLRELQRKIEDFSRAGGHLNEEMEDAVTEALESVKELSQSLCPVDTGRLRDSAQVTVVRGKNGSMKGTVTYDTPYAFFVHENPDAYHNPPTTFKFLEIAFAERRPQMVRIIEDAVRAALKG